MTALLEVVDLTKNFYDSTGLFHKTTFVAVENISFCLERKKTLAIIGKNGSGKSTLAKMIVGILEPTSGQILLNGSPLTFGDYSYRAKKIRMVFQDTNSAFDPKLNVGQILDLPLRLTTALDEDERNHKIGETLRLVGLYPDHVNIRINTMSVSQKQRIALARALILEPDIIIADDTLGSLDATVKTQLTNLMLQIQEKLGIAYIYIGQHLGIIKHISDQVLVMNEGKIIEYGTTEQIFNHPQSDVTKKLLEGFFED